MHYHLKVSLTHPAHVWHTADTALRQKGKKNVLFGSHKHWVHKESVWNMLGPHDEDAHEGCEMEA